MRDVSARLSLLDLQVVDADELPVGRVDDVELVVEERGQARVAVLACGQRALGPRLGGTLGLALQATAARLAGGEQQAGRIDVGLVKELTSVVCLSRPLRDLTGIAGLERWLAVHLVARLPGAGTPAVDDSSTAARQSAAKEDSAPPIGTATAAGSGVRLLLSQLLGAAVTDESGRPAGLVHDVRLGIGSSGEQVLGPVVGLVVGGTGWRARLAHAWGFAEGRSSGPALLRILLAPEAAQTRVVPVSAVASWRPPLKLAGPLELYPLLAQHVSGGSR